VGHRGLRERDRGPRGRFAAAFPPPDQSSIFLSLDWPLDLPGTEARRSGRGPTSGDSGAMGARQCVDRAEVVGCSWALPSPRSPPTTAASAGNPRPRARGPQKARGPSDAAKGPRTGPFCFRAAINAGTQLPALRVDLHESGGMARRIGPIWLDLSDEGRIAALAGGAEPWPAPRRLPKKPRPEDGRSASIRIGIALRGRGSMAARARARIERGPQEKVRTKVARRSVGIASLALGFQGQAKVVGRPPSRGKAPISFATGGAPIVAQGAMTNQMARIKFIGFAVPARHSRPGSRARPQGPISPRAMMAACPDVPGLCVSGTRPSVCCQRSARMSAGDGPRWGRRADFRRGRRPHSRNRRSMSRSFQAPG